MKTENNFERTFPTISNEQEYDFLFENVIFPAVKFITDENMGALNGLDRWLENSMAYMLQLCARYRFGTNKSGNDVNIIKGITFYALIIGDVLDKIDQLELFNRNLESEYSDILDVIGCTMSKNTEISIYHHDIRRDVAIYYINSRPSDMVRIDIIRTMIRDSRPGNGLSQEILNIVRIPIESALTMRGIEFPENYFNI